MASVAYFYGDFAAAFGCCVGALFCLAFVAGADVDVENLGVIVVIVGCAAYASRR